MAGKTCDDVRREFITFFESKGHTAVPSSPVVPADDPTLMFTNAGMNQFKDVFLGTGRRPYTRAADTQKCIRAGGKHNDLDDVGHDTYHHTFFEMLGNWSFGDYFKKEAITWAWELLTGVWGIDKKRLHATYFEGDESEGLPADTEARDLWASLTDIDPAHIHPGNKKDNFWEMGDTGPCGPCSEIHIDMTPDYSGGHLVNADDARVIEIWNLVFIQLNRDEHGKLTPLPAKHVDTGMGFERITAVIQGMEAGRLGEVSNYDTDVFTPIFTGIQQVTGAAEYTGLLESEDDDAKDTEAKAALMKDIAYRVIADHIRTLTFALTDGATPSNEGRGYVLRRILRRAVRYGRQYFNVHEPFLCKLVPVVVDAMGHAFPELKEKPQRIVDLVRDEEESFIKTLDRGIALFDEAADRAKQTKSTVISGEDAFKLHDTYGFPIDLTEVMARERGMSVDTGEYKSLMEEARDKARGSQSDLSAINEVLQIPEAHAGERTEEKPKYDTDVLDATCAFATGLGESGVSQPGNGLVGLVFKQTCFYAEQGGQVGDTGTVQFPDQPALHVVDTKRVRDLVVHIVDAQPVSGSKPWESSEKATLTVNSAARNLTRQNHTATHILNWALREVLEIGGEGKVDQKGSLVDPDKTRFDFSHNKPLTPEEIERIEMLCTAQIEAHHPVYTKEVAEAEARKINTLRAVFGEKYPEIVRVVSIGADIDAMLAAPDNPEWMKYSVEFCGGTHVKVTDDIGAFVLTVEESVAKGIRRVVGVSGEKARRAIDTGRHLLAEAETIKSGPSERVADGVAELQKKLTEVEIPVRDRVTLRATMAELQKIAKQQSKQEAAASAGVVMEMRQELLDNAERVDGTALVVGTLPDVPVPQMREAADWLRTEAGSAAVCLATVSDGKPMLIAAMTDDLVKKGLKAGDLIKHVVPAIDGRGGGKPNLAQAGGNNSDGVPQALEQATAWVKERLG